jgi:hypothetical protein
MSFFVSLQDKFNDVLSFWKLKKQCYILKKLFVKPAPFSFVIIALFFVNTAWGQYCNSYGNSEYETSITSVSLNTIDNITAKPDGYNDYTAQSTTVFKEVDYELAVKVNTDGNFKVFTKAWIDWNQDGDFNDSGEEYDLGKVRNKTNNLTSNSPLTITIPTTAAIGNTRMRISSKYNDYPSSCETDFDGEVEDYTINVLPTITTGNISPTTYCAGTSVNVPFTATGSFFAANIFTAQLSDASGSYTSPITIGSLSSTTSGTITATIPLNTAGGTAYRIRVVGSSPSIIGSDNGSDLSVNPIPDATGSISGIIAQSPSLSGQVYSISDVANANTYSWTVPTGWAINTGQGTESITVTTGNLGQDGDITVTASNSCGSSVTSSLAVSVLIDSDSDGVIDIYDLDDDNDGILDAIEMSCDPLIGYDGYWTFDNSTNDLSGNNYNLQDGSVSYSADSKIGVTSASFNGNSNYLKYSDGTYLNRAITSFSYAFWVKPGNLTGIQTLLDEGGKTNGIAIRLNDNILENAVREGGSGSQVSTSSFTFPADNLWHHIALTYDNGDVIMYLDGISSTVLSTGFGVLSSHSSSHSFGRSSADAFGGGTGNYYNGLMDDIIHYPLVLTAAEINSIIDKNCDVDNDGIPSRLDLDSDGDGCSDANEAYNDLNTDGGNGVYGTGTPSVDSEGKVTTASYVVPTKTSGNLYTFLQAIALSVSTPLSEQETCEAQDAIFTAKAIATILPTTPLTIASTNIAYKWQLSTDGGTNFSDISGETGVVASGTSVSLTLSGVTESMNGNIYKIIFSNEATACVEETEAVLTVNSTPDLSGLITTATDVCAGEVSVVTISTTSLPNGTYTINYTLSGANTQSATDETMIVSSGNSGTFNTVALTEAGTTNLVINSIRLNTCASIASSGNTATIITTKSGFWLGYTSSDWHTDSNWCGGIPIATTDVVISSGGNQPVISATAVCRDVTINSGAILTIEASGDFTVLANLANNAGTSGLILKSDGTNSASLVHASNDVPATVQRYISGAAEAWHFISSPVTNQSISGDWIPSGTYGNGTGYDLYLWNEPSFCWIYHRDNSSTINWSTVHPGAGFTVGRGYLYSVEALNPTKSFTGNLNAGEVNYGLTVDATDLALNGFNLIGNPYPSFIDWQAASGWTRSNLLDSGGGYDIWIWNPDVNNYGVCNSFTGSVTNGISRYIAPTQGFFVQAASAGNISMNNDVRVASASSTWFKKSNDNTQEFSLRVKSIAGFGEDEVLLGFGYNQNTNGAKKLFSNIEKAPSLYLKSEVNLLSVRYLSTTKKNSAVPVYFEARAAGEYTLISNFEKLQFETVMLLDLKTNSLYDFNLQDTYDFQALNTDDPNRFVLFFEPRKVYELNEFPAQVYIVGEQLIVDLSLIEDDVDLEVYSLIGKLLMKDNLVGGTVHNLDVQLSTKVIIVKVWNNDGSLVQKLLWTF